MLLVYAARHYRELSAQNELRPQDVMRILVHYHAYGNASVLAALVRSHRDRIHKQIDLREEDEVGRLNAEYQAFAERIAAIDAELSSARKLSEGTADSAEKGRIEISIAKSEKQREKSAAKIVERDERIAEARRRADEDRTDVDRVAEELIVLYTRPDELIKHARVVSLDEIVENEFNLNIPRYVDTFDPEQCIEVADALTALAAADDAASAANKNLSRLLKGIGYAS